MPMIKTDKTGFWFGMDDLIAAGAGAFAGLVSQAAGDIVTTIVTGEVHISSWQDYAGAMIGGAAGGVTTLYAGPVIGAAVSGETTTLVSEGIKAVTEPDYDKSIQSVLVEAGQDVLELSEEAFKGAVRPIEILKSICPNISDFIEEFIQDKDVWLEVSCDN